MVARLRGRPSPRPPGPPEAEEDVSSKASKPKSAGQRALVAVTVVSLMAAVGTTGTLLYFTQGGNRFGAQETNIQPVKTGPLLDLGPFIVNLGNVNERRYLRIGLSLDFQTKDPNFVNASENSRATWIGEFKNRLKRKEAMFKDVIVTTLSSKHAEDLGSTTGKESLKADLMARMNQFLDDEHAYVRDVYFTDFVIQ